MWRGLSLLASGELGSTMKRALAVYVIYGLAVVALLGAAAFGVGALHTYLAERYGSLQASLALGGLLLAVAVILALIAMLRNRSEQKRIQESANQRTLANTAMMMAPMAPTALRTLSSKPVLGGVLAVVAVGLGAWLGHQTEKDRPDA